MSTLMDNMTAVPQASEHFDPSAASSSRRARYGVSCVTVMTALIAAGAYVAYQRIGTAANIEFIEYHTNLAGGFLALGMTPDQPGAVVLSALDNDTVSIRADQLINWAAGTHTVLQIETATTRFAHRLRGPRVILVDEHGGIESFPLKWSVDDFQRIRNDLDCNRPGATRCGAPFADLHDVLARHGALPIPAVLGTFLKARIRSNRG